MRSEKAESEHTFDGDKGILPPLVDLLLGLLGPPEPSELDRDDVLVGVRGEESEESERILVSSCAGEGRCSEGPGSSGGLMTDRVTNAILRP